MFPFPKFPFRILVSWTLIITAPSFKWMLTFLPRNDLALFRLKLSKSGHQSASISAMLVQHCLQMGIFSPLNIMYNFMFSL